MASTILLRNARTIRLRALEIEQNIYTIQNQINTLGGTSVKIGKKELTFPSLNIPTRQQILTNFYYKTLNAPEADPQWLLTAKEDIKEPLDFIIDLINPVIKYIRLEIDQPLNDILAYVDIGNKIIQKVEVLLKLFNVLLKLVKSALKALPNIPFTPTSGIIDTARDIIIKITGWVKTGYETIKTWARWVLDFTEKTIQNLVRISSNIKQTLTNIVLYIRNIKAFIDSIGLDLLKSILGISPVRPLETINKYASALDIENNIDEDDEDATNNGDKEDTDEKIGNDGDKSKTDPNYYKNLTEEQFTRLNFIVDSYNQSLNQKFQDYLDALLRGEISLAELINIIGKIDETLASLLASLNFPEEEFTSLLEEYNISPGGILKQEQLEPVSLIPGVEYERYGYNRKGATVSYERKVP